MNGALLSRSHRKGQILNARSAEARPHEEVVAGRISQLLLTGRALCAIVRSGMFTGPRSQFSPRGSGTLVVDIRVAALPKLWPLACEWIPRGSDRAEEHISLNEASCRGFAIQTPVAVQIPRHQSLFFERMPVIASDPQGYLGDVCHNSAPASIESTGRTIPNIRAAMIRR